MNRIQARSTGSPDGCPNAQPAVGIAGVGFNTRLFNGKVLGDNGSGFESWVAQGIVWAADNGAQVISMSLGGPRYERQDQVPCPQSMQDAVLHAVSKGALVVAASGNSADDGSPVEEPGVCLGVVSVGAVDAQLQVTDFSSRHRYLSVTAPGKFTPTV